MPLPARPALAVLHWVATNHNEPCPTRDGPNIDASKKTTTNDDDDPKAESYDEAEPDFTKKKKKKKTRSQVQQEPQDDATASSDGTARVPEECQQSAGLAEPHDAVAEDGGGPQAADESADATYSYTFLLTRLHDSLRRDHPSHPSLCSEKKRSHVPPPKLAKVGGRRVAIANFGSICSALRRPAEHVKSFLVSELATTGAVDGAGEALTLLAALQAKQAEQLLKKYVQMYVQCAQCHSLDTEASKGKSSRAETLKCACCDAERLLDPIKAGFVALRRGERRAKRE